MEKEKFDLESFPRSKSALRMLNYVTQGFYEKSYVGKWLYQVMGLEYDEVRRLAEELPYQMFPEFATWGLMYHELKWGLPVRKNLSYEERRKLIYQKRDYRAPMTPYRMEKYLEEVTGFEVKLADVNDPGDYGFVTPHPNVFKAYFIGDGTLDIKKVHKVLNQLKQSHTTYTVNERIEVVLDNQNLERIKLKNIKFDIKLPFWYMYDGSWLLNGSWLLDGSILLNVKRRYGLMLGFKSRQCIFHNLEQIKLISVKSTIQINTESSFNAKVNHNFGINFWDVFCFDKSWLLDGSVLLDAKRRYGLSLASVNKEKILNTQKQIIKLGSKWEQYIKERIVARMFFCFLSVLIEVTSKVALTLQTDIDMSKMEMIANVTVETKSRDYWFLDGLMFLDGSKNFNAVYSKEAV